MPPFLNVKASKPLSPMEERYLRRIVRGNILAKALTLTVIAGGMSLVVFLIKNWIIPGLTERSPFAQVNYMAVILNIATLIIYFVTLLTVGALMLAWHPLKAGYQIDQVSGSAEKKGRSLGYAPLIAPPPWRRKLPLRTPVPMRVASFRGHINMGRRGEILLGVPQLGLDMEEHARLGLLKYRNPLVSAIVCAVSLMGVLLLSVFAETTVDPTSLLPFLPRGNRLKELCLSPASTGILLLYVLSFSSVLRCLFVLVRNPVIGFRISRALKNRPKKKMTWYK